MEKVADTHSPDGVGALGTWVCQELEMNADLAAPFAHTEKQHTEMPSTEEVLCQCSAFKAETADSPEAYLKICCCAYSLVAGRAAEQPLILQS